MTAEIQHFISDNSKVNWESYLTNIIHDHQLHNRDCNIQYLQDCLFYGHYII